LSAINDSGISFAENRTFRAFLLLYTVMSVLILALLGTLYYRYQKEVMLSQHRLAMQLQSESYIPRLKSWVEEGEVPKAFPEDLAYKTALFDKHGRSLASGLEHPEVDLRSDIAKVGAYIHFVIPLASYGMGTNFLIFETEDDGLWLHGVWRDFVLFGLPLFGVLLFVGVSLSRLFIRPMREAVELLDRFIKDTTHELNTPVSTIVANIETIHTDGLEEKEAKKIRRIDIAARTISTIYDDLTYLVLNREVPVKNEPVDLSPLLRQRLEYFKGLCEQKRLTLDVRIDEDVSVTMDRTKAVRLIDNLLSNAIKYNRIGGDISVELTAQRLRVRDSGIGIPEEKLHRIFERYMRADTTVGGFGIGLNIVAMIVKEYGFSIDVDSAPRKGTAITVSWKRYTPRPK
jgi:two-component system OmpR family sensor kinase